MAKKGNTNENGQNNPLAIGQTKTWKTNERSQEKTVADNSAPQTGRNNTT